MANDADNQDISLSPLEENKFSEAVGPLTDGLLRIYQPALTDVQKILKELTDKESVLLEQIHNENLSLSETQHSNELTEMFNKIELYHGKLVNIKKDMKNLHDKSIKLKKRALKIQQVKEKQEYIKQQKEAELKMEEDLIAKKTLTQ